MIWLRREEISPLFKSSEGWLFMKLQDEYILYIDEKINKDDKLFLNLKRFSSHIDEEDVLEEQKLSLCSELLSFSEHILLSYIDENISSSFKKILKEKNYEEAFNLTLYSKKSPIFYK